MVAEQWGRRWIIIDTSRVAIAIARQRLLTAKFDYSLVSRKKCTNPCSCETIVCTIPVASAAWCDRQA